jgi:hypothetical protein
VAGFNLVIGPKINVSFVVSKLGFSLLKLKQDVLRYNTFTNTTNKVGETESDYNAARGLDDLAMSIGISLRL